MAEQMGLDGILGDEKVDRTPVEKVETTTPDPVEKVEAVEKVERATSRRQAHRDLEQDAQGRVRDPETGQYKPKDAATKPEEPAKPAEAAKPEAAKVAAPVQEEMTQKERAAFAKAADETRKRQALEVKLREYEAKANPAEPAKPFWDDPEGAMRNQEQRITQAIQNTRLQTAETIARSKYTDFDEKVTIFSELAASTPGLAQQMVGAPDPAEFVYRTAANHKALREAGGLDEMRKKIEAETTAKVRAELETEFREKAEAAAKERAALPGSLGDAHSKGNSKVVWGGAPSLDSILGNS